MRHRLLYLTATVALLGATAGCIIPEHGRRFEEHHDRGERHEDRHSDRHEDRHEDRH